MTDNRPGACSPEGDALPSKEELKNGVALPQPPEGEGLLEPLMSKRQTASYLGKKSTRTLERWARDGIGPPYHRVGGSMMYKRAEVDAWLNGRKYRSHAEEMASAAA